MDDGGLRRPDGTVVIHEGSEGGDPNDKMGNIRRE